MRELKTDPVKLEVGEIIDISLESMMGSTGYGWYLSEMEGPILLIGISAIPTSKRAIAPMVQVFQFRGVGVGTAKVKLVKTRSWVVEEAVEEINYVFEVCEIQKGKDEDLTLKGFVGAPKADVLGRPIMLYNIQDPQDPCARMYYGVLCQRVNDPVRPYYAVLPKDIYDYVAPYYAACPPDECCPPVVLKYGIPPILKYGIPPVARYNYPPTQRYNYPSRFGGCTETECCD